MSPEDQRSVWRERAAKYREKNREAVRQRNTDAYHNKLKHDPEYVQGRRDYGKRYRKNQREQNPDQVKKAWRDQAQKYRGSEQWLEDRKKDYDRNRLKHLVRSARARAKEFDLPFDISHEDLVIPEICPVLGIPILLNCGDARRNPNAPSIDKVIPSRGYVKGNVVVVSWRANKLKSDATIEELGNLARFYNEFASPQ